MEENPKPELNPKSEENPKSNQESLEESIAALSQKLDKTMLSVSQMKERQDTLGHEVDILQTQSDKPKKWYRDMPVLVSAMALMFSAIATLYPILKEKGLSEEAYKNRGKQIVQRLSEIQASIAANGGIYGNMFAATQAEAGNLVDEAITISDIDPAYINDAGYVVVINQAFTLNKTERLKDLLMRAVNIVDDTPTHYSIKNSEANYYFTIKKDSIMGRNSIRDAIRMTESQEIGDDLKKTNIAQEYILWCGYEFSNGNYKYAEQLLEKAEELIVKRADEWRFKNYGVYASTLQWRTYFDSVKVKNPNFFN